MFNYLADIDIDATIGQVIGPTATPTSIPTSSPTPTSSGSSTTAPTPTGTGLVSTPTFKPVFTFPPTLTPEKQYRTGSFAVYGYGPINSEVLLVGSGVSAKTISDGQGFFVFSPIYSHTSFYPELCIQAVDEENRVTQPTCIPAFPATNKLPSVVGPVLLSPTLSLTSNKVVEGSNAVSSGKTIPNADVEIYIAKNDSGLSLIPVANAYYIPTIKIRSDAKGEFEFSLPTSDNAKYKIFVANKLGEDQSAKSNTLDFAVHSSTKSLLQSLYNFMIANKIRILVLFEALVAGILALMALKSTTIRHKNHSEKEYLEEIKNT